MRKKQEFGSEVCDWKKENIMLSFKGCDKFLWRSLITIKEFPYIFCWISLREDHHTLHSYYFAESEILTEFHSEHPVLAIHSPLHTAADPERKWSGVSEARRVTFNWTVAWGVISYWPRAVHVTYTWLYLKEKWFFWVWCPAHAGMLQ